MRNRFALLAALNALALLVTYAAGWVSWLRQGALHPQEPTYLVHFVLGLSTIILTLLVHCVVFTYFLGTGRWVKEVGLAYDLPDEPLPKRTRELKRRTFPPALAAMLIAIATAAAGMGTQVRAWPWPIHAALATLTLLVNAWAFVVEYRAVTVNAGVIEQVMREVERIRAERGLPPSAVALKQE
jgi:hypothetical protein